MIKDPIIIEGYEINVVLPFDYEKSGAVYPVVYVQDGGDMVMDSYNQLDHLIRTKEIEACIFVGIEPIERNHDYTPWRATGLSVGRPDFGGGAEKFLSILQGEIKPYIDANYRTKPDALSTTMAGASFGGLVSLFASYWYPNIFGNFVLLSPSMWYEGVLGFLQSGKPDVERSGQRMYMYVGELEGVYHTTLQQHMVPNCRAAADLLRSEEFEVFKFVVDPHGTHDAHFFACYFVEAMKELFPGR